MNIIARKPRTVSLDTEIILVDKGEGGDGCRYVTGCTDAHSLKHGEWYWGHYFHTFEEAKADFDKRS